MLTRDISVSESAVYTFIHICQMMSQGFSADLFPTATQRSSRRLWQWGECWESPRSSCGCTEEARTTRDTQSNQTAAVASDSQSHRILTHHRHYWFLFAVCMHKAAQIHLVWDSSSAFFNMHFLINSLCLRLQQQKGRSAFSFCVYALKMSECCKVGCFPTNSS